MSHDANRLAGAIVQNDRAPASAVQHRDERRTPTREITLRALCQQRVIRLLARDPRLAHAVEARMPRIANDVRPRGPEPPRRRHAGAARRAPSGLYVDAIERYANSIARSHVAFYGYYAWQVYVGARRVTGP